MSHQSLLLWWVYVCKGMTATHKDHRGICISAQKMDTPEHIMMMNRASGKIKLGPFCQVLQ